jgi:hypothetical protein
MVNDDKHDVVLSEMKKYIDNVPQSKDSLFRDMWIDLGKNVISRLNRQSTQEVLSYLKNNIDSGRGNNMVGVILLVNCSQQMYAKLWKLSKWGFDTMNIPRCSICGKKMVNAIDSKTKRVSPYLWQTDCGHNINMRICIG